MFIAGEQTHAFRKRAVLCGEADSLGEYPIFPTNQEVHLAQKILRIAAKLLGMCSSSSFLFARVDLIDDSGTLRLMELELVEPLLNKPVLFRLIPTSLCPFPRLPGVIPVLVHSELGDGGNHVEVG